VAAVVLCYAAPALGELNDVPLSSTSKIPVGINVAKKWFVAINQDTKETVTRYWVATYRGPRWLKARTRFRAYSIDGGTEESLAETTEKSGPVRRIVDESLLTRGVMEVKTIAGGFTGRYRIPELDVIIYVQKNQLVARTGDTLVPKTKILTRSLKSLVRGRCSGKVQSKLLHATYSAEWKSVAVYVEVSCTPESDSAIFRRARRLIVANLSKI
jgi:hypothetical protein